jgi:CRP/FNR family transcriptional regulator, cyclic AMP receptor protein
MSPKRELADFLAEVGLFSKCTARQCRAIARNAQIAELPAGVDLIKEGEPGDALYVILEGEALVHHEGVELERVGPGAYFGEMALLDGEPRSASVVAVTDMKVAVIDVHTFRKMLREFSDLAEQLLIALSGELRAARKVQEPT